MQRREKQDIYTRITNQIVSHLEKGVRPALQEHDSAD
jgi:antirestriction protein ArdC